MVHPPRLTAALSSAEAGADGVAVSGGSSLSFGPATSSGNGLDPGSYAGIAAGGGSAVFLNGGAVIDGNRGNGVMATDTSIVQKARVESNIHVTNNTNWGYVQPIASGRDVGGL